MTTNSLHPQGIEEDQAAGKTATTTATTAVTKDLSDHEFDDGKPVTTEELLELAFAIQSMSDILHEETQDVLDLKSEMKDHREGFGCCLTNILLIFVMLLISN